MTEWLMVIDLQPAFSHPSSPWFTPSLAHVKPHIAALVERFGERSLFTRFVPPAAPFGSWLPYYERWPFALAPESEPLWQLDPPWQGRPSIASHTFSKWIPEITARLGPDPAVVLCGVSTDCCVLMTALAAVDGGAHVRVVADACAAKSDSIHAAALALMATRAPQLAITTAADECTTA
jgi:nicotinamidase-related amidase